MSIFNWTKKTSLARSGERHRHTSVKLNSKMYILGGYHEDGTLGVCSSTDGVNWAYDIQSPSWDAYRSYHSSVAANNRMWVIGGVVADTGIVNDVWSSIDGSIWVNNVENAEWSKRYGHSTLFFNNKFWLMGGRDYTTDFNDIWNSSDGVVWYKVVDNAPWFARAMFGAIVFNGEMWVIGGSSVGNVFFEDVWHSSDGINWVKNSDLPSECGKRDTFQLVVYRSYLCLLGGRSDDGTVKNDVLYTEDGDLWAQDNPNLIDTNIYDVSGSVSPNFNGRYYPKFQPLSEGYLTYYENIDGAGYLFSQTINNGWMISGINRNYCNGSNFYNSNENVQINPYIANYAASGVANVVDSGQDWIWSSRSEHAAVIFDDKIWVINGRDVDGILLSDVWYGEILDESSSSSSSSSGDDFSWSVSSVSTDSSESESSSLDINPEDVTYFSNMMDMESINNPLMGYDVKMRYKGFFDKKWSAADIDIENLGYGLGKSINNRGLIFCSDASKLFAMKSGYVGLSLVFPSAFVDGVYERVRDDVNTVDSYILWGVNVGKYEICQPGILASITPRGLEFTIWTSSSLFSIVDSYSNIQANTNIFMEFYWGNNIMTIKINGSIMAIGNCPINIADSIKDLNFCLLDSPFGYSGLDCIIRKVIIKNLGN